LPSETQSCESSAINELQKQTGKGSLAAPNPSALIVEVRFFRMSIALRCLVTSPVLIETCPLETLQWFLLYQKLLEA